MDSFYDSDVDKENVIRREEIKHGNYLMDCALERWSEDPRAFEVNIRLKCSGKYLGYLSGYLLSSRPDPDFYFTAEPLDGELWGLVKIFCNAQGVASRIDHPKLQSSPSKKGGGFFHISKVEVQSDHRKQDLGLHMIHQALVFLRGNWSLAVISPGRLNRPKFPQPQTFQMIQETEGAIENLTLKLTQHYARMGFAQASKRHPEAMFLTRETCLHPASSLQAGAQTWIPKSQVATIQVFQASKSNKLSPLDEELHNYLCQPIIEESRDLSELRELIRRGASIEASNAMIHGAFHNNIPLMRTLLELGGNVNHRNERQKTPLHSAVECRNFNVVKFLIANGADKNAADEIDYKPIDALEEAIRNRKDDSFMVKFNPNESLVMPEYECLIALMPQEKRDNLIDGWMSPRMSSVLVQVTDDLIQGIEFFGASGLEYIPNETVAKLGEALIKMVHRIYLQAILDVLESNHAPTVQSIHEKIELSKSKSSDAFSMNGVKVEYTLDAVLDMAESAVVRGTGLGAMDDFKEVLEDYP